MYKKDYNPDNWQKVIKQAIDAKAKTACLAPSLVKNKQYVLSLWLLNYWWKINLGAKKILK